MGIKSMSTPLKKMLILIPNEGSAPKEKVTQAFAAAMKSANDFGLKEIVLLVPAKGNIDESFFGGILTRAACSTLRKPDGRIAIEGYVIRCESPETIGQMEGVVLAFYLSSEDLENVQTTSFSIKAIVFVPWLNEEGSSWYSTWNPSVIGVAPKAYHINLPETVRSALESLTGSINLSTGLSHPSDKKAAMNMLKELKESGAEIDPVSVRRWALQHGWRSRHAGDLEAIAEKYSA